MKNNDKKIGAEACNCKQYPWSPGHGKWRDSLGRPKSHTTNTRVGCHAGHTLFWEDFTFFCFEYFIRFELIYNCRLFFSLVVIFFYSFFFQVKRNFLINAVLFCCESSLFPQSNWISFSSVEARWRLCFVSLIFFQGNSSTVVTLSTPLLLLEELIR